MCQILGTRALDCTCPQRKEHDPWKHAATTRAEEAHATRPPSRQRRNVSKAAYGCCFGDTYPNLMYSCALENFVRNQSRIVFVIFRLCSSSSIINRLERSQAIIATASLRCYNVYMHKRILPANASTRHTFMRWSHVLSVCVCVHFQRRTCFLKSQVCKRRR